MQIRMANVAFAVFFIVNGFLSFGVKDLHWKYNGPSIPSWIGYVEIACGCIMLCMELWAARKRR